MLPFIFIAGLIAFSSNEIGKACDGETELFQEIAAISCPVETDFKNVNE